MFEPLQRALIDVAFITRKKYDDDCFYHHSSRNYEVIVLGALSSLLTWLHIVSGVVCVVFPFAGDEKLKTFMLI